MTTSNHRHNRSRSPNRDPSAFDRLAIALAIIFAVIASGTAGFILFDKRSFIDALYMTLVTISTLGMMPDSSPLSYWGKIWIMILIVVGLSAAMSALSMIVSMIVEGQVRKIFGRSQVTRKIASLSNHIIVCGYGRTGAAVCDHLKRRDIPVIVIDRDDNRTAQAEQDGFLYILGDANMESTLIDAGIKRAQALVCTLSSDADNVLVTLVTHDLHKNLFIATSADKQESEIHLRRAGANTVICPRMLGAGRLANIITRPGVVDFIDFASEGFELEAEQFHIQPNSKLVNQSLLQANLPKQVGILVVALKRAEGQTLFNPSADTVIQAGDTLIITGQKGSLAKLEKLYHVEG